MYTLTDKEYKEFKNTAESYAKFTSEEMSIEARGILTVLNKMHKFE